MTQMVWSIGQVALFAVGIMTTPVLGQDLFGPRGEAELRNSALLQAADQGKAQQPSWHYGGFIDLGYSLNFNFPANHLFRDRSTTPRVNELDINMAGAYVRKDPSDQSRWGTELLVQGGMDAKDYGFGVNLPKVQGSDALRHFGRANVSYLAPVGNGLTVQAELFNSLIGYESLYAKDNVTYTRAWIADYSPYLMFGANAVYPFNNQWTETVFALNEYFHLQNSNNLPSYGAQVAYKPSGPWTFKETIYYGPDQSNTSLEFWRSFSDPIVGWKVNDDVTVAGEYQIGTQKNATAPSAGWVSTHQGWLGLVVSEVLERCETRTDGERGAGGATHEQLPPQARKQYHIRRSRRPCHC